MAFTREQAKQNAADFRAEIARQRAEFKKKKAATLIVSEDRIAEYKSRANDRKTIKSKPQDNRHEVIKTKDAKEVLPVILQILLDIKSRLPQELFNAANEQSHQSPLAATAGVVNDAIMIFAETDKVQKDGILNARGYITNLFAEAKARGGCAVLVSDVDVMKSAVAALDISTNDAYARQGSRLFYINKACNEATEVKIKYSKITAFDEVVECKQEASVLNAAAIKNVNKITSHKRKGLTVKEDAPNECTFIQSGPTIQEFLEGFPIPANEAYFRHGSQLFYINKAFNVYTEIEIKPAYLKKFDDTFKPSDVSRMLDEKELDLVKSITGHAHKGDNPFGDLAELAVSAAKITINSEFMGRSSRLDGGVVPQDIRRYW